MEHTPEHRWKWRSLEQNMVPQVTQDKMNTYSYTYPFNQDTFADSDFYLRVLCFILTTMLVFTLSLGVALAAFECYRCYANSNMFIIITDKCNTPPSYASVLKTDKMCLPSYVQACAGNV